MSSKNESNSSSMADIRMAKRKPAVDRLRSQSVASLAESRARRARTLSVDSHLHATEDESSDDGKCSCCCDCGPRYILGLVWYYTFGLLSRMFTIIRELMYGDPESINWGERGRKKWITIWCCCRRDEKRTPELRFLLLMGAFSSFKDWALDILLLVKWFFGIDVMGPWTARERLEPWDYPKRQWEAAMLLFFILLGCISGAILSTKARGRGCSWKILLHLTGLGVVCEHFAAWNDSNQGNMMRYVNPFVWSELIFEKGPSALLILYVGLQDGNQGEGFLTLETFAIISTCFSMAGGYGGLVAAAGKQSDFKASGVRGWLRTIMAVVVMMFDVTFRSMTMLMWWYHLPAFVEDKFGFEMPEWLAFPVIFAMHFMFELIYNRLNRKYFAPKCLVLLLTSFVGVYNGSLLYFSRRWKSSEPRSTETKHYRTVYVFWLRWTMQWVFLAAVYFVIADCDLKHPVGQEGCDINRTWFWVAVGAGLALPFFFYLKPPSAPLEKVSPWAARRMAEFEKSRKEKKRSRAESNRSPTFTDTTPNTRIELVMAQTQSEDVLSSVFCSQTSLGRRASYLSDTSQTTIHVAENSGKPNIGDLLPRLNQPSKKSNW